MAHQTRIVLETERLRLRTMDEDDAPFLYEKLFQDEEVMKYYPSLKDEKQTKEWIAWNQKNDCTYHTSLWIIEEKETKEPLGQSGIVLQNVEGQTELEIGYMLKRSAWGKGYAVEAAKGCLAYGFDEMKVRRMVSLIRPDNEASVKVAMKMGMKKEKTISKWDQMIDVYSVTRDGKSGSLES
ncbi:GNAT family N-acetyltransferase [Bacillus altitudinis]|uniref:GNAT family N-acetyltransferase n=1 Tax=Bacillus altitudinis TaxID=293387 RepID=UPI001459481D|nr:GNAT family N-acetyltransferase [Bacillus altitudinis]MBU8692296.1 GNAT family N-acetyltransferase [Bacillus altitudinis]MCI9883765.1 GNAT family N-acetyltransferase [Bacillus altitudinis]NMF15674.1 GNAT family N-acetyltransferase [Bacillus altitudinis]NQD50262.1 GNAT family N-acetyltransferase [Bacillus altitudinis]QKJ39862.1 GNAT family N-acetyltransferase [Bacillus altitudinis]